MHMKASKRARDGVHRENGWVQAELTDYWSI